MFFTSAEQIVIDQAKSIIKSKSNSLKPLVCDIQSIKDLVMIDCSMLDSEAFGMISLDIDKRFISSEIVFKGGLKSVSVTYREVAKIALTANAAFVIVYHNHPSGDTTPSEPDIQMTEDLSDVLGVLGIQLMDHIITGADGSISLVEDGHFCFDEDYDDGDDD